MSLTNPPSASGASAPGSGRSGGGGGGGGVRGPSSLKRSVQAAFDGTYVSLSVSVVWCLGVVHLLAALIIGASYMHDSVPLLPISPEPCPSCPQYTDRSRYIPCARQTVFYSRPRSCSGPRHCPISLGIVALRPASRCLAYVALPCLALPCCTCNRVGTLSGFISAACLTISRGCFACFVLLLLAESG